MEDIKCLFLCEIVFCFLFCRLAVNELYDPLSAPANKLSVIPCCYFLSNVAAHPLIDLTRFISLCNFEAIFQICEEQKYLENLT
ncbi:hypothetical protein KFK09_023821 [Dendrobium nobile]|uniref:Secreted protein n=1 Tax=Dendrobium nobile TaxID=94219 RepID=A0A8T3ABA4_DENNO|nr:hypothetical protein KFK09_023821 [Dendrobium nobile]